MGSAIDRQRPRPKSVHAAEGVDPQTLRVAVIEAASQVIRARGLARTRMSHIARAAGCAEGSIYRYFPSKSELVREVIHSRLLSMVGMLAGLPMRAGTATVEANLLEAARAALASYGEGVTLLGGLLADTELLAAERELLAANDVGPHAVAVSLAGYLKAEQALGRVRADADVEVAARLLLTSCLGASLFRAIEADLEASDQGRFLRGLVTSVMSGLAPAVTEGDGDRPTAQPADRRHAASTAAIPLFQNGDR
jgi:AcrR family transcriptional regulator